MEKDRRFNLKLLVPPLMNNSQVSAVRPQESVGNGAELGTSKYFVKDQTTLLPLNKSVVTPTQPTTHDCLKMKVAPTEKEESNCTPGQLCSKMFDEVEKIKCWKVKVVCDAAQSERKLQENKRTIETQRKAIQELQFQNESLSIKFEEQMSENEDLRNKHNATRNLCNLLKETFERSADKMQMFESEREETHHLLMENSDSVQTLIAAFDHLRGQAEAHQKDMQTVKEGLQECEELKEKSEQKYTLKEKEVVTLKARLQDKEGELEKVQDDLHDTQNQCRLLQEATTQQSEDLKSSKLEQESLLEKLHSAEQRCKESETSREVMGDVLRQNKEEHAQILSSKDLSLQEVRRVKNEKAEKLKQVQTTLVELQNSLAFEERRSKDCKEKLMETKQELERSNKDLGEIEDQSAKKDEQITILQTELEKSLNSMELVKGKAEVLQVRVKDLQAELSAKTIQAQLVMGEAETIRADNEKLKKAGEKAKEVFMEKHSITESKAYELEDKLFNAMKKSEDYSFEIVQLKTELAQHEEKYEELLSNFNEVHREKNAVEQQLERMSSNMEAVEANMKVSEEEAVTLTKQMQKLEEENQRLRAEVHTIQSLTKGQCDEIEMLQKKMEDNFELLQEKVIQTEGQLKAAEAKCSYLMKKIGSHRKARQCEKEIKKHKTEMAKQLVKYSQLENKMSSLNEESQNQKRQLEEKHQKLLEELRVTSSFAAELDNEMQVLRITAAEAVKSREDAELKCQNKTADMVALMEKHKSQYDHVVKEKDAELEERKKSETEAVGSRKSLALDVSKLKTENRQLTKQLMTEKDNFQKELSDLKKELSSLKLSRLSQKKNNKASAFNTKDKGRCADTPRSGSSKMNVFDFAKELHHEDFASPGSGTKWAGRAEKIKTYRIRTPPSAEKSGSWARRAMELEPKSDSSDPNNILTVKNAPASHVSIPPSKCNRFKKSPASGKSPGTSLKLAAIKRMRDAGWTAVIDSEKKKKKTQGKIFS
ncbi:synaptonemal complex protein 1 [Phyllopteryx taeniolatus]|uniref:synaptonemal complex protein 1 n=1 Tax=Phyllopteryx taeniolatus TaxID=161469 RepID=UPI002AD3CE88|nr:synaptonemal complex protein 1 [Phyllopteryx taeniolatus]XP_061641187.1 synaptonemal complex protein 1 [Phyllopteryx taeniolatus]